MTKNLRWAVPAALLISAAGLAGCEADGDEGTEGGAIVDDTTFPNDGTTPGNVTEGGVLLPGNFICEAGARAYPTATTTVTANGLIGGLLTPLLNLLGANTVANLLNSVSEKELAIDGRLPTHSTFSLTVDLLGLLSTLDQAVELGSEVPTGNYAVFGLSFPPGLLEASTIDSVTVTTYLGETEQESATTTRADIDLLGVTLLGDPRLFVGMKTTKPYDTASIGLAAALLSLDVNDAMRVHEMCTQGRIVAAAVTP